MILKIKQILSSADTSLQLISGWYMDEKSMLGDRSSLVDMPGLGTASK